MIRLTREDLQKSKNGYIQELIIHNFYQSTSKMGVEEHLLKDAVKDLQIDSKQIPFEFCSKDKILDYIVNQLGQQQAEELLGQARLSFYRTRLAGALLNDAANDLLINDKEVPAESRTPDKICSYIIAQLGQQQAIAFFEKKCEQLNKENTIEQILKDGLRGLLVNDKPIPAEFLTKDKITGYIIAQLGHQHGLAFLENYSQNPAYTLPMALGKPFIDNCEYVDYSFSDRNTQRTINIYVKNDQLCYEVKLENIQLHNGRSFPGFASCLNIYDPDRKQFAVQEILCSNKVLLGLVMGTLFEDEELFAKIKTKAAEDLIPRITAARKILLDAVPWGYSATNPPWTARLNKALAAIETRLQHDITLIFFPEEYPTYIENYKKDCQQIIVSTAQQVFFDRAKHLLNRIAIVLGLSPPFKVISMEEIDYLKELFTKDVTAQARPSR